MYCLLNKESTVATCLPQVILNDKFLSCPHSVVNWIGVGQMPWFLKENNKKCVACESLKERMFALI